MRDKPKPMPSLIDIRRRIRAVKSTQQITRAMKMVDSSKLRRAQERILSARPFAGQMLRVLNSLASRVDPSAHPLLAVRDEHAPGARALLIVISADKGLCGSFNTNIVKRAAQFIAGHGGGEVVLALVGRKARDFFRRRGFQPCYERINVSGSVRRRAAVARRRSGSSRGRGRRIIYNSSSRCCGSTRRGPLLPIADRPRAFTRRARGHGTSRRRRISTTCCRGTSRSRSTGRLSSRPRRARSADIAMDNATNAGEMVDQLTLYMNKLRQAAITREIIEVVSGAEALRGREDG
jgi:F-type H+-transporting ATPase subunit gamma